MEFATRLVSAIIYTGNNTTDGPFSLTFSRAARSDTATSSAQAGFPVSTNYRINEIDATVSGNLVRKYALAYSTGDNGHRSVLASITKSGVDSSGNSLTLPATTFTYQTSAGTKGWTAMATTTWAMPTYMSDNGPVVVDVNGDGLPDVVESIDHGGGIISKDTWLNKGNGSWTDVGSTSPWAAQIYFNENAPGIADLNGDGLQDTFRACCGFNDVQLNNGNGWTEMSTSSWQMIYDGGNNPTIIDVNGDGLPDIVENSVLGSHVYINNGNGTWTDEGSATTSTWYVPVSLKPLSAGGYGGIEDLNGDGLPDLFYSGGGTNVVYLNDGHGWVLAPGWQLPEGLDTYGPHNFVDVNGDGLPDMLRSFQSTPNSQHTWINNGDGTWTDDAGWYAPMWFNNFSNSQGFTDLNGDGMPDAYYSTSVGSQNTIWLNNSKKSDQLVTVQNPIGGSTNITYATTPLYKDGSGNLLNPSLPYVIRAA